jgi:hypothetical protein
VAEIDWLFPEMLILDPGAARPLSVVNDRVMAGDGEMAVMVHGPVPQPTSDAENVIVCGGCGSRRSAC